MTARRSRRVHRALPGRGRQLRGVDRRGRCRVAPRRGACAVNEHGRRERRRGGRRARGAGDLLLDRLRLRRHATTRLTSSHDETGPLSAYGTSKLAGELATDAANPRHFIVRASWLFGVNGRNFVDTMLGLAQDPDEVVVVRDQIGCPTYTGHLAAGLVQLLDGEDYGIHHMAGGGACSWYEFAVEIFRQAQVDCRVLSLTSDMLDRPAPAPRLLGARHEREHPIVLPDWHEGLADYLAERAEGVRHEAAGHRRSRLHRLQLRALLRSPSTPTTASSCSTSSPTRGASRTLAGPDRPTSGWTSCEGDIADADAVARALEGCDAIVNFAAESHVDRSIEEPGDFIQTDVFGTYVLLEAARARGHPALRADLDRRGLRLDRRGLVHREQRRSTPPLPTRPRRRGGDLLVERLPPHLRDRRDRLPRARTTTGPTSTRRS